MQFDVVIIGGGLVGLSLARALDGSGLSVALVDRAPAPSPADVELGGWDARVYAISPGSEAFLSRNGAWPQRAAERIAPVLEMQVFGDAPGSRIVFAAYDAHVERLAAIVESRVLGAALWEALGAQRDLAVLAPAGCESVNFGDDAAQLTLTDGSRLRARLLVAADGQDSWLRTQAGIATTRSALRAERGGGELRLRAAAPGECISMVSCRWGARVAAIAREPDVAGVVC